MIANRELGMEDYLAIAKRRAKIVIFPALIAALLGFLISYALRPKYTSQALLAVTRQLMPAGYVKPIITEKISDRMIALEQQVLSRSRLRPLVSRFGLANNGKTEDEVIDQIQQNVQVTQADPSNPTVGPSASTLSKKKTSFDDSGDVPGFYVNYTADNPRNAQQVCAEITSMLLAANLELRQQVAQSTTDFLSQQLQQAKQNLDELDAKLAEFKKLHLGHLPTDEDKNLRILTGLDAQLDANVQAMDRAQQDKSFAESELAQEMSAWKLAQGSPNLPPLRQQLVNLENQLVEMKSRYTDDHPDVVKLQKDIADLKATLKMDPAQNPFPEDPQAKMEPAEILRLKEQIHQNTEIIARTSREQKRIQGLIDTYQDRLQLSPEVEEQYKQLTRDNETAHTIYDGLLTNQNAAQMQTDMERKQEGEQIRLLDPASLPDAPSFPIRWMFALGGLGAGLCIGISIAFWKEMQDKGIRSESDVVAALELPMLVALPWAFAPTNGKEHRGRFLGQFERMHKRDKSA
jgi:uncharacterized protein involved in exopolysaccharide biosynthesis